MMSDKVGSGIEQARLDVGDTRKPAAIKNSRRVTNGDLSALAMCAHLYDPKDVRGWYSHDFDDVVRQWICSNVESVIARLSPYCEDSRGDLPPLHRADDLWVGEVDTGPTQTTLVTDGGTPTTSSKRSRRGTEGDVERDRRKWNVRRRDHGGWSHPPPSLHRDTFLVPNKVLSTRQELTAMVHFGVNRQRCPAIQRWSP